jgi:hypothetical protein
LIFLGNFRVCYWVRVTRRVRINRRVRVWNYFFIRMRVRVTRRVKFCGYGYGWALPVGYVPVVILRRDEQARQDTRGTFGTFANLASPISSLIQQDGDSLDRRKEGEAGE